MASDEISAGYNHSIPCMYVPKKIEYKKKNAVAAAPYSFALSGSSAEIARNTVMSKAQNPCPYDPIIINGVRPHFSIMNMGIKLKARYDADVEAA